MGHALGDPAAAADHDIDVDPRMALGEALEDERQHVAARRGRRRERQLPALRVAQGAQLLLHALERVEHALGVERDDLAGLREGAPAPVTAHELLPDGGLERLEVLGRRGLAHAARLGRGRDRPAAAQLDEEPQSRRVERVNYAVGESHECEPLTGSMAREA
jgi:hypothetical protein